MKLKIFAIGVFAAVGLTAACETTNNTNTNRASMNSNVATVVNSSSVNSNSISPVTTINSNTTSATNANRTSINYNSTAKENEAQKSTVLAEAQKAGNKIGTGAEDWWIYGKTNAALMNSDLTSSAGINVDVDNGKITLRGTVPNKEDIAKADKIAKGITGNKGVSNQLKVGTSGADSTTSNTNHGGAKK
jgi:osmotically-inducible protein OsmY